MLGTWKLEPNQATAERPRNIFANFNMQIAMRRTTRSCGDHIVYLSVRLFVCNTEVPWSHRLLGSWNTSKIISRLIMLRLTPRLAILSCVQWKHPKIRVEWRWGSVSEQKTCNL